MTSGIVAGTVEACASGQLPGAFVAIDQRAGYGPPQHGPYEAQIVTIRPGNGAKVLAARLPAPTSGGVAVSPDGHVITFGRDMDRGPGNQNRPNKEGLWLVQRDGSALHRLFLPPPSAVGNVLAIGPIAWSPDGKLLAYAVQPLGSGVRCPDPTVGGIWITAIAQPHARSLAPASQLGTVQPLPPAGMGCAAFISRLSWSSDGRRIAASTFGLKPGTAQPGDTEAVILAVDATTGQSTPLIVGASDGVFAPGADQIAYVTHRTGTTTIPAATTLWVADGQGRSPRKLLTREGAIQSPVWSPDGHVFAFLRGVHGQLRARDGITFTDEAGC